MSEGNDERGEDMKATIDSKSIEIVADELWMRDFEKRAEREIRKQRIFDITAEGIDPEIAALMVDFDFC